MLRRHRDQLWLHLADPADKGPGEESEPDTGPQLARRKLTDQETVADSQAQLSTPETDTGNNPEPESSGPQLAEQQPEYIDIISYVKTTVCKYDVSILQQSYEITVHGDALVSCSTTPTLQKTAPHGVIPIRNFTLLCFW